MKKSNAKKKRKFSSKYKLFAFLTYIAVFSAAVVGAIYFIPLEQDADTALETKSASLEKKKVLSKNQKKSQKNSGKSKQAENDNPDEIEFTFFDTLSKPREIKPKKIKPKVIKPKVIKPKLSKPKVTKPKVAMLKVSDPKDHISKPSLKKKKQLTIKSNKTKVQATSDLPVGSSASKQKEVSGTSKPASGSQYRIQLSSFRKKSQAETLKKRLDKKGYNIILEHAEIPNSGIWYRVFLKDRFIDRIEALKLIKKINHEEKLSAFLKKYNGGK